MGKILWKERKRTLFGLPLSFTIYTLEEDKLIIETGFFSKVQEEVRLYRIMDLTLKRSFGERLFGLGTIHCCSGDKSTPEFNIERVKKSQEFKDLLSDTVEAARKKNRITTRESMHEDYYDDDDDDDE